MKNHSFSFLFCKVKKGVKKPVASLLVCCLLFGSLTLGAGTLSLLTLGSVTLSSCSSKNNPANRVTDKAKAEEQKKGEKKDSGDTVSVHAPDKDKAWLQSPNAPYYVIGCIVVAVAVVVWGVKRMIGKQVGSLDPEHNKPGQSDSSTDTASGGSHTELHVTDASQLSPSTSNTVSKSSSDNTLPLTTSPLRAVVVKEVEAAKDEVKAKAKRMSCLADITWFLLTPYPLTPPPLLDADDCDEGDSSSSYSSSSSSSRLSSTNPSPISSSSPSSSAITSIPLTALAGEEKVKVEEEKRGKEAEERAEKGAMAQEKLVQAAAKRAEMKEMALERWHEKCVDFLRRAQRIYHEANEEESKVKVELAEAREAVVKEKEAKKNIDGETKERFEKLEAKAYKAIMDAGNADVKLEEMRLKVAEAYMTLKKAQLEKKKVAVEVKKIKGKMEKEEEEATVVEIEEEQKLAKVLYGMLVEWRKLNVEVSERRKEFNLANAKAEALNVKVKLEEEGEAVMNAKKAAAKQAIVKAGDAEVKLAEAVLKEKEVYRAVWQARLEQARAKKANEEEVAMLEKEEEAAVARKKDAEARLKQARAKKANEEEVARLEREAEAAVTRRKDAEARLEQVRAKKAKEEAEEKEEEAAEELQEKHMASLEASNIQKEASKEESKVKVELAEARETVEEAKKAKKKIDGETKERFEKLEAEAYNAIMDAGNADVKLQVAMLNEAEAYMTLKEAQLEKKKVAVEVEKIKGKMEEAIEEEQKLAKIYEMLVEWRKLNVEVSERRKEFNLAEADAEALNVKVKLEEAREAVMNAKRAAKQAIVKAGEAEVKLAEAEVKLAEAEVKLAEAVLKEKEVEAAVARKKDAVERLEQVRAKKEKEAEAAAAEEEEEEEEESSS